MALINIILSRLISFLRVFLIFSYNLKKPGLIFIVNRCKFAGLNKIFFDKVATIRKNVKISSIGSKGFEFGNADALAKTIQKSENISNQEYLVLAKNVRNFIGINLAPEVHCNVLIKIYNDSILNY